MTATALTSTTLSAAVTASQTAFSVASATGITVPTNSYNTVLYVEREAMLVIGVSGKVVTVIRGMFGSQADAHISGSPVLIGPPGAFQNFDPQGDSSGALYNPTVNQRTSNQWIPSTVSGQWVPGFGNPGTSGQPGLEETTAVTGATILPTGPLMTFTGTTALVTITAPPDLKDGYAFTLIFTGSGSGLTWTAAGNISPAGTSTTANSTVTFVYNLTLNKWVPSRLA